VQERARRERAERELLKERTARVNMEERARLEKESVRVAESERARREMLERSRLEAEELRHEWDERARREREERELPESGERARAMKEELEALLARTDRALKMQKINIEREERLLWQSQQAAIQRTWAATTERH
jgi:hypothetical protein